VSDVVVVVVVDSYSASRSASIALIVFTALWEDEFSEPICSCRYSEHGPWIESGIEFHSIGPAVEKARQPKVLKFSLFGSRRRH